MHIPDYAKLRENAGKERAAEMRRLATLFRRIIRRVIHSNGKRRQTAVPHGALRPVPVSSRRWPPPYDIR